MSDGESDNRTIQQRPILRGMGMIGTLAEFKIGNDWCSYEERMDQYFIANYVEEDKKVPVLLTVIGEQAYEVLRGLCDPDLPKSRSYDTLCRLLREQFSKKVSVFKERIEFYDLRQLENETVKDFYVRLKNKAIECKFGNTLNEVLRDRFVSGLKRGSILDRVCEEEHTVKLDDILQVALKKEAALASSYAHPVHKLDFHKEKKTFKKQSSSTQKNGTPSNDKGSGGKRDQAKENQKCRSCGEGNHNFSRCKYKTYTCKVCKKVGHLAKVCRCNQNNYVEQEQSEVKNPSESFDFMDMYFINQNNKVEPIKVNILVNNKHLQMEIDTGAGISVIPANVYESNFKNCELKATNVRLRSYNGSIIVPEGELYVSMKYQGKCKSNCRLIVIKNGTTSLLGRDLMKAFNINIKGTTVSNVNNLTYNKQYDSDLSMILKNYNELFNNELGLYKFDKVELQVNPEAKPIFCKPRPIPFAFRELVNKELDELESKGVISPIKDAEWGTPLVPVLKDNGKLRLCADYKITINKFVCDVKHPLPRIEELFAALQGGERFTKLDLASAYNQLELTDSTKLLLAWSTHKGIYKLNRLPYGTKPACAIFQKTIEKVLQGLDGVIVFLDDIVVTGRDRVEHLENVKKVFDRLSKAGFKLNLKKCKFFEPKITYLGHIIDKDGLHKDPEKTRAMCDCPRPADVSQVKAYIGMINYYGRFVPNLSTLLEPLYKLLRSDVEFKWNDDCQKAFLKSKQAISSDQILTHFDPNLPLKLVCDASQVGIGSVLLHVYPDGTEKPISFASRVLNKSEVKYSVIHKEALSIYWSVRKFYQYLMGNKFLLCSDHLPLKALFGEHKGIPQMAAGRLQRWAIFLGGFNYVFKHIKGSENGGADGLSRIPVQSLESTEPDFDYFNFLIDQIPVDSMQIIKEIRTDSVLSKVFLFVRDGWPEEVLEEFKPYKSRAMELSIDNNLLMWGYRVLIPFKLRAQLLDEIHGSHNGMSKMKSLARQYFWWPNLDSDIEKYVKKCNACMINSKTPNKSALIKFNEGKHVFDRIHIDFLGPFRGKTYLIIIDSYSKWPEIYEMQKLDSATTIEKLRDCFARFGLPNVIVSDNGAQLVSVEFENFCKTNRILHVVSPPYHPSTNGAAENGVKSFKSAINKFLCDSKTCFQEIPTLINKYLFSYRNTPHSVTEETPSKLMFSRKVKTRLDFLINTAQLRARERQIKYHHGNRIIDVEVGELVYVRDYRNPNKPTWTKAVIEQRLGIQNYLCRVLNDERLLWRRHLDQLVQVGKFYDKLLDNVKNDLVPNNINFDFCKNNNDISNVNVSPLKVREVQILPETSSELISEVSKPESLKSDTVPSAITSNVKFDSDIANKLNDKDVSSKSEISTSNIKSRPRRQIKPPERLNL